MNLILYQNKYVCIFLNPSPEDRKSSSLLVNIKPDYEKKLSDSWPIILFMQD